MFPIIILRELETCKFETISILGYCLRYAAYLLTKFPSSDIVSGASVTASITSGELVVYLIPGYFALSTRRFIELVLSTHSRQTHFML